MQALSNVGGNVDLNGNFNGVELPLLSKVGGGVNVETTPPSFQYPGNWKHRIGIMSTSKLLSDLAWRFAMVVQKTFYVTMYYTLRQHDLPPTCDQFSRGMEGKGGGGVVNIASLC